MAKRKKGIEVEKKIISIVKKPLKKKDELMKVEVAKPKQKDPLLTEELKELEHIRPRKTKEKEEEANYGYEENFDSKSNINLPGFYVISIIAAYLFTIYISIFAAIHFNNIQYMNITIVFLFTSMSLFFLISAAKFFSEKKRHYIAPVLFFIGIVAIMVYAFKAVDTSKLVMYTISYTIIITAISISVLSYEKIKHNENT